ncbi:MAG: HPr family phosphocarrier protein [Proteobacteria bacterium]|nr:HPr family phosphocarrier protein [Pseudomonadota bacterium]
MVTSQYTIANRLGLHARAAAQMVKAANRFVSEIRVKTGDREVNGKSIMGILTLAAIQGSLIILTVEGPDEKEALTLLGSLIMGKFGEE